MGQAGEGVALPRTTVGLLRDRQFGTVFWGKGGNLLANWAFTLISVSVAYDMTCSAAWTGAVSAAQMAPGLLLTLLSGRLSDSYGERVAIVVGGLLSGLASVALALWWWTFGTNGQVAVSAVLAFSFVGGCGMAFTSPAQQSIVTRLVQPAEISAAVSLNFLPTAVARTFGPAGGAVLLALVGPAPSFVVVGVVLIGTAIAVHLARLPGAVPRDGGDARIRAAGRYVLRERVILAYLFAVAALGAGAEPAITLAPAIADSAGRHDAAGWVLAAFGGGGAFGVIVHRLVRARLSPTGEGCAAMIALALTMALTAWSSGLTMIVIFMLAGGCSMVVGITAMSVGVQQRCDAPFLGRVMAMWVLAFAGVRPIAALAVGSVASAVSVPAALLTTTAMLIVATMVMWGLLRSGNRGARAGQAAQLVRLARRPCPAPGPGCLARSRERSQRRRAPGR